MSLKARFTIKTNDTQYLDHWPTFVSYVESNNLEVKYLEFQDFYIVHSKDGSNSARLIIVYKASYGRFNWSQQMINDNNLALSEFIDNYRDQ